MVSKNLFRKSAIYFVGNLSSKFMSAIIIPIYAFYISVDDLGTYDFTLTLMGILTPVIILAIWESVLKFTLSTNQPSEQKAIISTASIFTLGMCCLFAFLSYLAKLLIGLSIPYYNLIVIMIVLHTIVIVWQYIARGTNNSKLYVVSGIFSTIISFLAILIFVILMRLNLLGLLLSYCIGQITIIMIIEFRLKVFSYLHFAEFNLALLGKMLRFSLPLVMNLISIWLISGFARFIITLRLGIEANGLYSFANKFSVIITMIGNVVTMAIIEEAIIIIKDSKKSAEFNSNLQKMFVLFQTLAILSIPTIVVFYSFIEKTDYYKSIIFTPPLILYAVFMTLSSSVGAVFQSIEKTKFLFLTTLLGGFLTVLFSLIFIDQYGIFSVLTGQLVGALAMLISRSVLVTKYTSIRFNTNSIIVLFSIFIIISIFAINMPTRYSIFIEIVLLSFGCYKYRDLLYSYINRIKSRMRSN